MSSAVLFGWGFDGSPEVPDVPDVTCEPACDEPPDAAEPDALESGALGSDAFEADGFASPPWAVGSVEVDDMDFWDFGAVCEAAAWPLSFPFPGSARAVPLAPKEMIIRSSAATTDMTVVNGRARSRHVRNMDKLPANPPDPEMGAGLENHGHHRCSAPQRFPPGLRCTREKEANNLEMVKC